jgi:pimeloyl-ACP methyl ester carboxylesterase
VDITSESVVRGIRERAASIVGSHGEIPLALWTSDGDAPKGLVLVGHGASGHKRQDYVVALARRLVRTCNLAVCSIDGPVHGGRRTSTGVDPALVLLEFAQAWSLDSTLTDGMRRDWSTTLDELQGPEGLGDIPVGYWGISMGTLLGLPFVAADERVEACVFGLAGLTGPTAARLADDAPKVTVPTLFLVQLGDDLFSTESSLALFEALGSTEKRLFAAPGRHRDVPSDAFQLSVDFLASHLTAREGEPAR